MLTISYQSATLSHVPVINHHPTRNPSALPIRLINQSSATPPITSIYLTTTLQRSNTNTPVPTSNILTSVRAHHDPRTSHRPLPRRRPHAPPQRPQPRYHHILPQKPRPQNPLSGLKTTQSHCPHHRPLDDPPTHHLQLLHPLSPLRLLRLPPRDVRTDLPRVRIPVHRIRDRRRFQIRRFTPYP